MQKKKKEKLDLDTADEFDDAKKKRMEKREADSSVHIIKP